MKINYVKQIDQRVCDVHYQARNEKTEIPVVHKRAFVQDSLRLQRKYLSNFFNNDKFLLETCLLVRL